MKKINIGGVPEHFNLPWHLTLENGEYEKENINLQWHDYYGGTGAMCKALRDGDIDMAIILTEGIVKDIIAGNPCKIVQTYVETPLNWGVHVANNSTYKTIDSLKGTKAAISRYGSGSHLMAYINAQNNNWNLDDDLYFEVIKNLDGAVEGLTNGDADYFLWEKYTTKPLVDDGTFRRIGNCPSPWPCFVIAVREDLIKHNALHLKTVLSIINSTTIDFKNIPSVDKTIANRYKQQIEDVQEWLSITEWSQKNINNNTLMNVQKQLFALNIIPDIATYNTLVHQLDI